MKFVTVTLFTMALALGVQSSVIPWGGVVTQINGGHLAHTAVLSHGLPLGGTVIVGYPPAAVPAAISLPGGISTAIHAANIPAHIPAVLPALHAGVPALHAGVPALHAGDPALHAGVPAVVAGQAGYVAKTRGALHTAPLAGHLNSVANVNVAPAPGTI